MDSILMVIESATPFIKGEIHTPEMINSLIGLEIRAEPFTIREQGDLFTGFTPTLNFYTIQVEDLLEALDRLADPRPMNYWLKFWVEKMVCGPFTAHLGAVRERSIQELYGI